MMVGLNSRQTKGGRLFARNAVFVLASILAPNYLYAQAGDLDTSFGVGGKVTTGFGDSSVAVAAAIQPDGKIVAAGFAVVSGNQLFALARYNTNGTLDASFGTGGRVTTDFFGSARALALAIQGDDKIVAAGLSNGRFALARYNRDGALDTTFGGGGKVTTDFGSNAVASAVAIQPDGKIVAAGDAVISSRLIAVARYNTDGTLDTSFGSGGKVTTDFGGGGQGASAVAIQPDGKIVTSGFAFVSGFVNFAVVRYNTDGTLDTSFGGGGRVTTDFTGGPARAVAIQPDGKIVAAGFSGIFAVFGFALARYNTDGALDASFGDGGKVTTFDGLLQAFAVAIQADGKIVAAGPAFVGDFALVRYNANGTLDASFGIAGKVTTDFAGNRDMAFAVAIQADGQIVAAGSSVVTVSNRDFGDFALARYDGGFTPLDLTIALSARAQALVNAGIFNAGQGNSLNSKLTQAVRSLGRGEINTACNQLRAFINEINALITGGVLTSAQGQLLINAATGISNRLGCR